MDDGQVQTNLAPTERKLHTTLSFSENGYVLHAVFALVEPGTETGISDRPRIEMLKSRRIRSKTSNLVNFRFFVHYTELTLNWTASTCRQTRVYTLQ